MNSLTFDEGDPRVFALQFNNINIHTKYTHTFGVREGTSNFLKISEAKLMKIIFFIIISMFWHSFKIVFQVNCVVKCGITILILKFINVLAIVYKRVNYEWDTTVFSLLFSFHYMKITSQLQFCSFAIQFNSLDPRTIYQLQPCPCQINAKQFNNLHMFNKNWSPELGHCCTGQMLQQCSEMFITNYVVGWFIINYFILVVGNRVCETWTSLMVGFSILLFLFSMPLYLFPVPPVPRWHQSSNL